MRSLLVHPAAARSTAQRILELPFEGTGEVPPWSVQRPDSKDAVFQDAVHALNHGAPNDALFPTVQGLRNQVVQEWPDSPSVPMTH